MLRYLAIIQVDFLPDAITLTPIYTLFCRKTLGKDSFAKRKVRIFRNKVLTDEIRENTFLSQHIPYRRELDLSEPLKESNRGLKFEHKEEIVPRRETCKKMEDN